MLEHRQGKQADIFKLIWWKRIPKWTETSVHMFIIKWHRCADIEYSMFVLQTILYSLTNAFHCVALRVSIVSRKSSQVQRSFSEIDNIAASKIRKWCRRWPIGWDATNDIHFGAIKLVSCLHPNWRNYFIQRPTHFEADWKHLGHILHILFCVLSLFNINLSVFVNIAWKNFSFILHCPRN